jgi:hypothetical protein
MDKGGKDDEERPKQAPKIDSFRKSARGRMSKSRSFPTQNRKRLKSLSSYMPNEPKIAIHAPTLKYTNSEGNKGQ